MTHQDRRILGRFFSTSSKRTSLGGKTDIESYTVEHDGWHLGKEPDEVRLYTHATRRDMKRPLPAHEAQKGGDRQSLDLGQQSPSPPKSRKKLRRRSLTTSTLPEKNAEIWHWAEKPPTMATAVTIQTQFVNRTPPLDLYAIQEDAQQQPSSEQQPSSPTTPDSPRNIYSIYPVYTGLQSSARNVVRTMPDMASPPPRRGSHGSVTTNSSMYSRESVRSEMMRQSSSWGSKTSFDSMDTFALSRPEPLKRQRSAPRNGPVFASLPGEVLEVILDMLKESHLGKAGHSCATCWMRDLCNISICSRKWSKFARKALYEEIQLVGPDSAAHRKKFKLVHGGRMLMLRRTLRANPELAVLVRSLKIPKPDTTIKGWNDKTAEQYEDMVAALVMACPNLERLSGPPVGYDHSFKRIFQALSSRSQLKEMDWLIEPSPVQQEKGTKSPPPQDRLVMPVDLDSSQKMAFLDQHRNWSRLSSLSIHCLPGATLSPDNLLTRTIACLPSLEHLHLCNLPANAFNDKTLLALPSRLKTLSLTHITGVTSAGLSAFATHSGSQSLQTLHLRHTPLANLATLARILSNLPRLQTFSLAQAITPLMPEEDCFTLWMMPYLASSTIKKIHWDITSHRSTANVADDILARSIAAGGFPKLTLLRTPNDPEGIFQDLCRPVERISNASDRFLINVISSSSSNSTSSTPTTPTTTSMPKSPLLRSSTFPTSDTDHHQPPPSTDLRLARIAAQARLERARQYPRFAVNVLSEEGRPVERFHLAGYLGTVGSPITYHLFADEGASDDKGGVVDVRDLTNDAGEMLKGGKEGCTGVWNRAEGVVADKKEREKWFHTERGRWTRIEL